MFLQQKLHPKFSRNASNYSNLQENKQYGQTTQKPKIGQKVENTEKQKCVKTLLIIQILLTNDQNDQTKQEMKRG